MENIKIFACSEYAEPFTKEICDYLDLPMGKINRIFNNLYNCCSNNYISYIHDKIK